MEALSQHVHERLVEDAEATAQRELERNSLEEVKKIAIVQASELIYQREMESIREDHERTLRNQRLDMDTYLRLTGQTEQDWQDQLRPQAEDRLISLLVLRKLAEQENLEVEPSEVDAEIDRLMENSSEQTAESLRRMLGTDDSRESIRSSLLNRKVMSRLVEIVSSEPAGDSPEETAEAEEIVVAEAAEATGDDDSEGGTEGAESGEQHNE
jgi:trigger factor